MGKGWSKSYNVGVEDWYMCRGCSRVKNKKKISNGEDREWMMRTVGKDYWMSEKRELMSKD